MTQDTVPIFLNDAPLAAMAGHTLGQVLAVHDPELLALLLGGTARVTDARGLPVDPDRPVHAGAIFRVFRSARRDEDSHA